ncbi:MAG: hypothetical protein GY935_16375 [Gammaproteobacteria bacterium]|nr:hypothetical protein [Gammaproteobacteria bacterium]
MSSILFAIVIVCMLAAIVMLVFKPYNYGEKIKSFKKISSEDVPDDSSTETRWRSVKIRPGLISCKSVASLNQQIFLSKDAPALPLAGCSENDCNCHYIFLDDRRSGSDRRIDLGRLGEFFPNYEGERRQVPGRRMGDLAA